MYINSTECCGLDELSDISYTTGPRDILAQIKRYYNASSRSFLLFTGVTKYGYLPNPSEYTEWELSNYGQVLADYIKAHGLGHVVRSKTSVNRNSGNTIRVWIWQPDWAKIRRMDFTGPKPKARRSRR